MSENMHVEPDLAALYLQHRESMHRVAASVLRGVGLTDLAADAVQDAIVSMMASPPTGIRNWEAFMVAAAKRKAIDRCRSRAVVHAGPEFSAEDHDHAEDDVAENVVEEMEKLRLAGIIHEILPSLDERHRTAVWQFAALGHPRKEIALELGVTGPRVTRVTAKSFRWY